MQVQLNIAILVLLGVLGRGSATQTKQLGRSYEELPEDLQRAIFEATHVRDWATPEYEQAAAMTPETPSPQQGQHLSKPRPKAAAMRAKRSKTPGSHKRKHLPKQNQPEAAPIQLIAAGSGGSQSWKKHTKRGGIRWNQVAPELQTVQTVPTASSASRVALPDRQVARTPMEALAAARRLQQAVATSAPERFAAGRRLQQAVAAASPRRLAAGQHREWKKRGRANHMRTNSLQPQPQEVPSMPLTPQELAQQRLQQELAAMTPVQRQHLQQYIRARTAQASHAVSVSAERQHMPMSELEMKLVHDQAHPHGTEQARQAAVDTASLPKPEAEETKGPPHKTRPRRHRRKRAHKSSRSSQLAVTRQPAAASQLQPDADTEQDNGQDERAAQVRPRRHRRKIHDSDSTQGTRSLLAAAHATVGKRTLAPALALQSVTHQSASSVPASMALALRSVADQAASSAPWAEAETMPALTSKALVDEDPASALLTASQTPPSSASPVAAGDPASVLQDQASSVLLAPMSASTQIADTNSASALTGMDTLASLSVPTSVPGASPRSEGDVDPNSILKDMDTSAASRQAPMSTSTSDASDGVEHVAREDPSSVLKEIDSATAPTSMSTSTLGSSDGAAQNVARDDPSSVLKEIDSSTALAPMSASTSGSSDGVSQNVAKDDPSSVLRDIESSTAPVLMAASTSGSSDVVSQNVAKEDPSSVLKDVDSSTASLSAPMQMPTSVAAGAVSQSAADGDPSSVLKDIDSSTASLSAPMPMPTAAFSGELSQSATEGDPSSVLKDIDSSTVSLSTPKPMPTSAFSGMSQAAPEGDPSAILKDIDISAVSAPTSVSGVAAGSKSVVDPLSIPAPSLIPASSTDNDPSSELKIRDPSVGPLSSAIRSVRDSALDGSSPLAADSRPIADNDPAAALKAFDTSAASLSVPEWAPNSDPGLTSPNTADLDPASMLKLEDQNVPGSVMDASVPTNVAPSQMASPDLEALKSAVEAAMKKVESAAADLSTTDVGSASSHASSSGPSTVLSGSAIAPPQPNGNSAISPSNNQDFEDATSLNVPTLFPRGSSVSGVEKASTAAALPSANPAAALTLPGAGAVSAVNPPVDSVTAALENAIKNMGDGVPSAVPTANSPQDPTAAFGLSAEELQAATKIGKQESDVIDPAAALSPPLSSLNSGGRLNGAQFMPSVDPSAALSESFEDTSKLLSDAAAALAAHSSVAVDTEASYAASEALRHPSAPGADVISALALRPSKPQRLQSSSKVAAVPAEEDLAHTSTGRSTVVLPRASLSFNTVLLLLGLFATLVVLAFLWPPKQRPVIDCWQLRRCPPKFPAPLDEELAFQSYDDRKAAEYEQPSQEMMSTNLSVPLAVLRDTHGPVGVMSAMAQPVLSVRMQPIPDGGGVSRAIQVTTFQEGENPANASGGVLASVSSTDFEVCGAGGTSIGRLEAAGNGRCTIKDASGRSVMALTVEREGAAPVPQRQVIKLVLLPGGRELASGAVALGGGDALEINVKFGADMNLAVACFTAVTIFGLPCRGSESQSSQMQPRQQPAVVHGQQEPSMAFVSAAPIPGRSAQARARAQVEPPPNFRPAPLPSQ